MGHKNIKTTERYAKVVNEELDKGIEQMPVFNNGNKK